VCPEVGMELRLLGTERRDFRGSYVHTGRKTFIRKVFLNIIILYVLKKAHITRILATWIHWIHWKKTRRDTIERGYFRV